MPARPLPPALDELQVSGTDYPRPGAGGIAADPAPATTVAADERVQARHAGDPRGAGSPAVVTVAISPLVRLSTGKAAAQCGHAAQLLWEHLVLAGESEVLRRWHDDAWRIDVRDDVTEAEWARLDTPVKVVDAGFTEVDGPTETTRAWLS